MVCCETGSPNGPSPAIIPLWGVVGLEVNAGISDFFDARVCQNCMPLFAIRADFQAFALQKHHKTATKEQFLEYFEARLRTEKYAAAYFLAESEAKQSESRNESEGARARSGRGFKLKGTDAMR
jgi:hypothetical protein